MIINNTRFAVGELLHPWSEPGGAYEALTIVVKATFSISAEGHVALAEEQLPVRYSDELTGEDDEAPSARLPADVVPEKGAHEVVVAGHAYLPPGQTEVTTRVHVGSTAAPLRVHGPRFFDSGLGGVRIGEAVHVPKVPLTHESSRQGDNAGERYEQGTPEYRDQILRGQIEDTNASPEQQDLARDVRAGDASADYIKVTQPCRDSDGSLLPMRVEKYDEQSYDANNNPHPRVR